MKNEVKGSEGKSFGTIDGLSLNDHACFIYSNQYERLNMMAAQINSSISNGEACVCLVEENEEERICNFLDSRGFDTADAKARGALFILNAKEVYLQKGFFNSLNLVDDLANIAAEAESNGYINLRVINEMSWALEGINNIEKLIKLEYETNSAIKKLPIILICQYDINMFSPEYLKNIINAHPMVIYNEGVFKNSYYITAEEYFDTNRAKMEVIRLLHSIKKSVQAEDEILDLAFEHQNFINGFTGMIFYKNLNNKLIWVNDNYVQSIGISREDLLSKDSNELFPSIDNEHYNNDDREVIETGIPKRNIIESVVTAEGEKWVRTDKVPMINRNGEVIGIMGFSFDITEERKLQRALKKSEELYHSVYDNSPLVCGIWDTNFKFVDWNKRGEEVFGWSKEEVLGKEFMSLVAPPEIRTEITHVAKNLLDTGVDRITANENITKDGTILFCEWHNTLLHDNDGNLIGTISLGLDKTENRRAEKAILEAKELAEKANNELTVINAALEKQIAERIIIEDALRKSKLEADVANMAKSQFLANMSHEIRTPMNGIMGMVELLLYGDLSDDQKEMVNIIRSSAGILLQIINDILDLSKIEAGKVELKPEHMNIDSIGEKIDALVSSIVKNKNLSFKREISEDVPKEISVDSVKLLQIITNLIGNAVKFTDMGEICLKIKKVKEVNNKVELMVSVSDEGIGIKEEDVSKLFSYFTQLDDTKTKAFQGAGLGLAISKRLVELMGGEICVESEIGKGSTFYFTFWADSINIPKQDSINTGYKKENEEQKNLRILLVEDDFVSQLVVKRMCKMRNWDISIASNGREAIEILAHDKFDLILMDIQMPEMSGIDVTKIIREKEKTTGSHVPIIAATAYAMASDKELALNGGMDDYISKPIGLNNLEKIIRQYTNQM